MKARFYALPWEQQQAVRRGLWVLGVSVKAVVGVGALVMFVRLVGTAL